MWGSQIQCDSFFSCTSLIYTSREIQLDHCCIGALNLDILPIWSTGDKITFAALRWRLSWSRAVLSRNFETTIWNNILSSKANSTQLYNSMCKKIQQVFLLSLPIFGANRENLEFHGTTEETRISNSDLVACAWIFPIWMKTIYCRCSEYGEYSKSWEYSPYSSKFYLCITFLNISWLS